MSNSKNLDNEMPKFCVGQRVSFSGEFSPGITDEASYSYDWTFSGKFVNHSSQASSHASVNYDIDGDLLRVAEPYAWWYSAGNKNAYLNETLHFSNGQSATVSASGQFNMFKPKATMVNAHVHGTPTVIWERQWGTSLSAAAIQLGVQGGTNCMAYDLQVTSSDFPGEAKITQLCTINSSGLGGSCSGCLDGSDPYNPSGEDRA